MQSLWNRLLVETVMNYFVYLWAGRGADDQMLYKFSFMDHPTPLISFLLPAYKSQWIAQSLESILGQTYTNIELVIVNDSSPEDIKAIVGGYSDSRIRYYENAENIGGKSLVKQWEKCISYARGEYLVLAGDDDVYHPRFAEACMDLVGKYPFVDIVRARVEQIDEKGEVIGIDHSFPELISQLEYAYNYRCGDAFICIGNFLFRTSVLRRVGIIDFPNALGSDISTSIDLAKNGMANSREMLFSFRQSTQNLSGSVSDPELRLSALRQFYDWIKKYHFKPSIDGAPHNNRYTAFYQNQLTARNWDEKYYYDCYCQVVSHLSLCQFFTLGELRKFPFFIQLAYFFRLIKQRL